ncbi:MAG TPA: hypothetical protein VFC51_00720 [Chloroflexota bacterium]|nr:hypothetical protein [Chloroflexota bacterium]
MISQQSTSRTFSAAWARSVERERVRHFEGLPSEPPAELVLRARQLRAKRESARFQRLVVFELAMLTAVTLTVTRVIQLVASALPF